MNSVCAGGLYDVVGVAGDAALAEIIEGRYFRVPDCQRGYA